MYRTTFINEVLSLYSTATQSHSCWVVTLAKTPNAKFCVANTNILVSKNAKICVTPMRTPNVSQWNIGGVGFCGVGARIGHIHIMFVSILFQWVPNTNVFSVKYWLQAGMASKLATRIDTGTNTSWDCQEQTKEFSL